MNIVVKVNLQDNNLKSIPYFLSDQFHCEIQADTELIAAAFAKRFNWSNHLKVYWAQKSLLLYRCPATFSGEW